MIHPISSTRLAFCGPTAVAAITGLDITSIETIFWYYRGLDMEENIIIEGVFDYEILKVLEYYRFRTMPHYTEFSLLKDVLMESRTFYSWNTIFLVTVPNHVLVVNQGRVNDTTPEDKLVEKVWSVWPIN